MSNREKFASIYHRNRAQLLANLKDQGWKTYQLANRFRLSEERINNIIHAWRKRVQP